MIGAARRVSVGLEHRIQSHVPPTPAALVATQMKCSPYRDPSRTIALTSSREASVVSAMALANQLSLSSGATRITSFLNTSTPSVPRSRSASSQSLVSTSASSSSTLVAIHVAVVAIGSRSSLTTAYVRARLADPFETSAPQSRRRSMIGFTIASARCVARATAWTVTVAEGCRSRWPTTVEK